MLSMVELDANFCKYEGCTFFGNYTELNRHLKESGHGEALYGSKPSEELMAILKDPNLFKRITEGEFDKTIVGEAMPKKAIFLSCCSIFAEGATVHTIITDESSTGKSYIAGKIRELFPKESVEYFTKMSPEALTYLKKEDPKWTWDGKLLFLEDASNNLLNSETFKVMASEGTKAVIVANHKAEEICIKGKPMMLITTASGSPNLEVANRFNFIGLDSSDEQTKRIMKFKATEHDSNITEALSYLKRVKVVIPYKEKIADKYPVMLRARRDYPRFCNLIKASTALHQYQRNKDERGAFIANQQDYEIAREAFLVISPSTQFGLSYKHKKAFEACKNMDEIKRAELGLADGFTGFTADEIQAKHPFASRQTWYHYLDALCQKKMLGLELRKKEDSDKQVRFYKLASEIKPITLPNWDELT